MKPASEHLTATRQFFGDGEYWFFLPLNKATELEKLLGRDDREGRRVPRSLASIHGALLNCLFEENGRLRLLDGGEIFAAELNHIVRFGLLGGDCGPDFGEGTAVGPQRADSLIKMYGYPSRPVEEVAAVAFRLLHAMMLGDPKQRERLPDVAAESDRKKAALNEAVGPLVAQATERSAKVARNT